MSLMAVRSEFADTALRTYAAPHSTVPATNLPTLWLVVTRPGQPHRSRGRCLGPEEWAPHSEHGPSLRLRCTI